MEHDSSRSGYHEPESLDLPGCLPLKKTGGDDYPKPSR